MLTPEDWDGVVKTCKEIMEIAWTTRDHNRASDLSARLHGELHADRDPPQADRVVIRRTFEATKHPEGSIERARLNSRSETSEYMPSYRYQLNQINPKNSPPTFRTKREAEIEAGRLNADPSGFRGNA